MGETRFSGDRYQRLRQGALVLGDDPMLADGVFPFDPAGLTVIVSQWTEHRVLDVLSDRDADMASALLLLDYPYGAAQLAWRLEVWPSSAAVPPGVDGAAVAGVLATALALVMTMAAVLPTPQREH